MTDFNTLDRIIHPKSVAVVGASPTPGKYGWMYLSAIQRMGYAGEIYPINGKVEEIRGIKAYASLDELPEAPDLAVFTIPARSVPEELERARRLGVKGAIIQSAGFSENGAEGARLEAEIKEISKKGIRVIGPNCFGTYSPKTGVTVIPGFDFSREPGPVGFFAQSGGMTADLGQLARSQGVRFSAISLIWASRRVPSAPSSEKPADWITAPFTPRRRARSSSSGTNRAGMVNTARSGTSGSSSRVE